MAQNWFKSWKIGVTYFLLLRSFPWIRLVIIIDYCPAKRFHATPKNDNRYCGADFPKHFYRAGGTYYRPKEQTVIVPRLWHIPLLIVKYPDYNVLKFQSGRHFGAALVAIETIQLSTIQ